MPDIFLLMALVIASIAGLLFFAPNRRLLNFAQYGPGDSVRRLNRHAAVRLLIPVGVNLACGIAAGMRPEWEVPLIFLTPLSVLCVVLWVGIGARAIAAQDVSLPRRQAPPSKTAQCKLSIANGLMLLGMAPLLLGVSWIAAVVSSARQDRGAMGGSDAFLMIAVLVLTYAFALLVAGSGALWSRSLVRRHVGLRTRTATVLKRLVAVALAAPLVWYACITLPLLWMAPGR